MRPPWIQQPSPPWQPHQVQQVHQAQHRMAHLAESPGAGDFLVDAVTPGALSTSSEGAAILPPNSGLQLIASPPHNVTATSREQPRVMPPPPSSPVTVTPRVGTSGGVPSTPSSAQRVLMAAGQQAMGAIGGRVFSAARDVAHRVGHSSHRVSGHSSSSSQRMRALVVPMPQSLDDDTEEDYDTTSGRNGDGRDAAGLSGLPLPAVRVRSLRLDDDEARGGGAREGAGGDVEDELDAIALPTMHVEHPHPTSLVHTVPPSRPELNGAPSVPASPRITAWDQPGRPDA